MIYVEVKAPFSRSHKNQIIVGNPKAPEPYARAMAFDDDTAGNALFDELKNVGAVKKISKAKYLEIVHDVGGKDDDAAGDDGGTEKHLSRMTTDELREVANGELSEAQMVEYDKLGNNKDRAKFIKDERKVVPTDGNDGAEPVNPDDPDAAPT